MNRIKGLLIAAMLILGLGQLLAAPMQDFMQRFQDAQSNPEKTALIREYLPKAADIDELRLLQSYWLNLQPDSCRAYFKDLHAKTPKSPENHYLYLRADKQAATVAEQVKLCKKHPKFYWGYRFLVANLLSDTLLTAIDPKVLKLEKTRIKYLDKGLKRFPADSYLQVAEMVRQNLAANLPKAAQALGRISDSDVIQMYFDPIFEFTTKNSQYDAYGRMVANILHENILTGELAQEDSLAAWYESMAFIWLNGNQQAKLEQIFIDHPDFALAPNFADYYEQILEGKEAYPELADHLQQFYAQGGIDYPTLKDKFGDYAERKEFQELFAKAKTDWENSTSTRRDEALKDRLDQPAPLWDLPDPAGNIISLAKLKGMVIVLDFWASWCNPCRKAMPALDNWMKHEMSKGVQVFSINIFDAKSRDKALSFFKENGFHMTLLFAEDSLAKEYGFNSIPYICVIDKKGNLAYTQLGYTPQLEENLSFWTKALLQE